METTTLVEQTELNTPINDVKLDNDLNTSMRINAEFPFKNPTALIGEFYDASRAPVYYFVRLLAYKYLFDLNYSCNADSNNKNANNLAKLKSDKDCKVLVKAIAWDCCASAITLMPSVLFASLFVEQASEDGQADEAFYIYEMIYFVNHSDDKMKTTACLLIGQLINSVLHENDGNYDVWLNKMVNTKYELLFLYFFFCSKLHLIDRLSFRIRKMSDILLI